MTISGSEYRAMIVPFTFVLLLKVSASLSIAYTTRKKNMTCFIFNVCPRTSVTSVLAQIRVLQEPSVDHCSFEPPLAANFECWNFLLGYQSVDGEFINLQVMGYLISSQQIFLHRNLTYGTLCQQLAMVYKVYNW